LGFSLFGDSLLQKVDSRGTLESWFNLLSCLAPSAQSKNPVWHHWLQELLDVPATSEQPSLSFVSLERGILHEQMCPSAVEFPKRLLHKAISVLGV
jgi:hypothetical protein